jgi:hypothetical protein
LRFKLPNSSTGVVVPPVLVGDTVPVSVVVLIPDEESNDGRCSRTVGAQESVAVEVDCIGKAPKSVGVDEADPD